MPLQELRVVLMPATPSTSRASQFSMTKLKLLCKATISTLPVDNYGVHVENERDALSLLWLVNTIGEEKLRKSASKRNKYYPEAKLFVSTLAKRFQLKIPRSVFAPQGVAVFFVYMLVLKDRSEIKVGMTGRWPLRALDFVKTANYGLDFSEEVLDLFDGERSVAYLVSTEEAARRLENSVKESFATFRVAKPTIGGCGHTEWFHYDAYDVIAEYIVTNARGSSMSLYEGLKWIRQQIC
jgi:hypothetical protein